MDTVLISVGMILADPKENKRYRVIAITSESIVLCEMDISTFELIEEDKDELLDMLLDEQVVIETEETIVFDIDDLSQSIREKFEIRRSMMQEVVWLYEPSFMGLTGRKARPELKELMKKYSVPRNTFWRVCIQFFQSGMKEVSLVDKMAFGVNKGKDYQFKEKPGKKPQHIENAGVVLTEEVLSHFEEALKEYKSGRHKSVRKVFARMNYKYYRREELVNGKTSITLVHPSERPTYWQLYHYIRKHLSKEEWDRIKTSAAEQRNDKRLCLSDSLNGVYGPGDMIEIDAWEVDVSLVSVNDENCTVGRPILYCMIDVYSKLILAVSVSFDNNSILGITNLFLNLSDNKKELCEKYGIFYENNAVWPSNIIPRRIRLDRGVECKSKEVERICVNLGIERQLVPGATGSLKSVVENSFWQMISEQVSHLEDHGLIEKRYDSKHHQEATLNIEHYRKMALVFVLWHNQRYNPDYPVTREMIEQNVYAIPAKIWEYGVNKYGTPRPITSREQYMFTLLTPVTARINREGICYKNLWYFCPEDKKLLEEMYNAGDKKRPFKARMDMRDIGHLYYLRDGKLRRASLNVEKHGNGEYSGLTMVQYDKERKQKKKMDAIGRDHNDQLDVFSYAANQMIVEDAIKSSRVEVKGMRQAREQEKQMISHAGCIAHRLENDVIEVDVDSTDQTVLIEDSTVGDESMEVVLVDENLESISEFDNWDEVFDALSDNW